MQFQIMAEDQVVDIVGHIARTMMVIGTNTMTVLFRVFLRKK
jgi:hypothetical protein